MGVWIDTDMGFDDIAAILVVEHAQVAIDGVSLVFGVATLEQVRRNAAGAAEAFGWRFPIHTGRALPVLAKLETAERILGATGILTAGATLPDAPPLAESDAFAALCAWLERDDGARRILALGPLTNIAAVVLARPDLAARIADLTWMGGGVTSGNHTASAEFNAYADPEAVAIVLAHGVPLRMIDLDLCRKVVAFPDDVLPVRAAGGRSAALLADMLAGYIDIGVSRGRPGMALYDPTAAVAFARPDLVTFRQARIDAELGRRAHARAHGCRDAGDPCDVQRGIRRRRQGGGCARPDPGGAHGGGTAMSGRAHEPHDLDDADLRTRAVAAARGDAPFDVLIAGGTLVDVVTGELRAADVGVVGPLIASVHGRGVRLDAATVIDVDGSFVAPGLIDTHMHVESSMVTPAAYAAAVVPRGVTTIVWDPHEFGNVLGLPGVRWAIDAARDLPLRTVMLAPSCVPSAPGLEVSGADFDADAMAEMLSWPEIGGVAEVMDMRGVIRRDRRISAIVQAGLASGKMICGHARGLEGADLNAFMAAGISSDHELTSADDLMVKLKAGLTIELRGSHAYLLPEFAAALAALGHMPQTVTICTDDVFPDELVDSGGLDAVVRRLVGHGLRPEWALRAATLNAATRLGRADLGLIAAGRRADIAVFADLEEFQATHVFAGGRLVARDGQPTGEIPAHDPDLLRGSMKLVPLAEDDFRVRASGRSVRLATIDRPRFTRWGESEARVERGFAVPPDGTTMIAVVHRHGRVDARPRVGFLTGWGEWRGAFCTTVSHDSHNLTVFGSNARDMAVAANAVIAAGGGLAVASGGKIDAAMPLPLAGLVSDKDLATVADGFRAVRAAADRIVDWEPPLRTFKACFGATLACNAGPHQTDRGIADVSTGTLLESPVLEDA